MKKITHFILPLCVCFFSLAGVAQQSLSNWSPNPLLQPVREIYKKESAVILEDQRIHELKKDEKEVNYFYTYNRRSIRLIDDKGVEMYNKIYIFIPLNAEVTEIKARTIQPNGKVVNLPADKIFDVEEEGSRYKKFALEGIEKGSQVEYFVRMKKEVATFGLELFKSGKTPIEKASFQLIVPEHLVFHVKGYNGFNVSPEINTDKKRTITATEENIDALDEDTYAVTVPYSKNVQYKLAYNLDKDKSVRMYTWNELAKNVYNNYHNYTEKEVKALAALIKQIKLTPDMNEEAKIIAVEDFLKTNFNSDENAIAEDADQIERIVKTRVTSNFGFTRLFLGVLEKAGITNQIVYPSKRDDLGIDEQFENYRLIEDMLIYFPGTGKFLDPADIGFRYPYVQPYRAGTRGLFLKGTQIGEFKTAIASFDSIPLEPYEHSANNLFVQIKFNEGMDTLLLNSKQSLLGYSAASYRPAYSFLTKDKQDEFTKEIIKTVGNSDKITNIKVENMAMIDGSKGLPLNIMGDIKSAGLTEKAGNKILVKIGEVIGSQIQMYQEKKRQLPVLIQYPHALDREIRFTIPAGYQVKNLEDLNLNITDKANSPVETMGFISSYTLKGSELVISLHEFYKEIHYPVSRIEEFRNVVNAAADFNKVILVLEKI